MLTLGVRSFMSKVIEQTKLGPDSVLWVIIALFAFNTEG